MARRRLIVGSLCVLMSSTPAVAVEDSRYVDVELELPERPTWPERLDTRLQAAADRGRTVDGSPMVDVEVMPSGSPQDVLGLLRSVGASQVVPIGKPFSATVPVSALRALGSHTNVAWVRSASTAVPMAVAGEGVAFLGADVWQDDAGITGSGVKIAIIDAGFGGYGALLGDDLPSAVTTQNYCSSFSATDHGTAVAEIVHEMAPDSALYLICVETVGDLSLAKDYAVAQGADIISMSLGWYTTGRGDGTGVMQSIVEDARANGILWVASAGNNAKRHWSGTFTSPDLDDWHNFAFDDESQGIFVPGGFQARVALRWDDWTTNTYDYDLYLVDAGSNLVAFSINDQTIGFPPVEELLYTNAGPDGVFHILIHRFETPIAPVEIDLFTNFPELQYQVPTRSVVEPATSPVVLAVGAVDVDTSIVEPFSSHGPTIDGASKPDLVGPDKVSGVTYGPDGFYGTSASAPHVAGAAALVLQANPSYTVAQLETALLALTVDAGPGGIDNVYGSGILHLGVPPVDLLTPVLSDIPSEISTVDEGPAGATVDYTSPSALDAIDGPVPVNCTPASGTLFPLGETAVECTATDSSANEVSAQFTVTVFDGPPTLTEVPSDISVDATSASGAVIDYTPPTAVDTIDGDLSVSCVPAPASLFPVGDTTVECQAADSSANSVVADFTATVIPGGVHRYAGSNRYGTAAAIAEGDFPDPDTVDTVFVAVGTNFPDALAGAAVAGKLGAPLLLVQTNAIPGETTAELSRLAPDTIVILGGTSVISPGVQSALGAYATTVTRLAGVNRYETAVAISQYGFSATADMVLVATGLGFADALSGASAAVAGNGPVLLTDPNGLPAAVVDEIVRLDPSRIVVVGGIAAVSNAVFTQLQGLAPDVDRIAGPNRYETAVAISMDTFEPTQRVYLATGLNFPDALAGAAAAGWWGGPVLLVPSDSLPGVVSAEIDRLGTTRGNILGGTAVISVEVETSLVGLIVL